MTGPTTPDPMPPYPPPPPPPTPLSYSQRLAAYVRQNSRIGYTTRLTPRQLRRLAKKQRHQTVAGRTA